MMHQYHLVVPPSAIDANGHANNVEYIRWMQEAAISHSDAAGCSKLIRRLGATWVVREHHVEYLRPAFAGDAITVRTGVTTLQRVRSVRCYAFVRDSDGSVLARGETLWVYLDSTTGKPQPIPAEVACLFPLAPRDSFTNSPPQTR